jgi:hypothetical protein
LLLVVRKARELKMLEGMMGKPLEGPPVYSRKQYTARLATTTEQSAVPSCNPAPCAFNGTHQQRLSIVPFRYDEVICVHLCAFASTSSNSKTNKQKSCWRSLGGRYCRSSRHLHAQGAVLLMESCRLLLLLSESTKCVC